MFTDKVDLIIYNGVAAICGNDIIPKRIGIVSCSWTDDEGKLNKNKFNNVPYFMDSLEKILSVTALYESMKDDEETWVPTKGNIPFLIVILGSTKIQ